MEGCIDKPLASGSMARLVVRRLSGLLWGRQCRGSADDVATGMAPSAIRRQYVANSRVNSWAYGARDRSGSHAIIPQLPSGSVPRTIGIACTLRRISTVEGTIAAPKPASASATMVWGEA